jgi:hypothetical protein
MLAWFTRQSLLALCVATVAVLGCSSDDDPQTRAVDDDSIGGQEAGDTSPEQDADRGDSGAQDPSGEGRGQAYRIVEFVVRDPHFIVRELGVDATDLVNQIIDSLSKQDKDGDGIIDLSHVAVINRAGAVPHARLVKAACSASAPDRCTALLTIGAADGERRDQGSCLEPDPSTLGQYPPSIVTPQAPCLVTEPVESVTMELPGYLSLTMTDIVLAAEVDDEGVRNGYMRGFLSREAAEATILGPLVPFVAGKPLSVVLPEADMDGDGWLWHINFSATPATCGDC